MLPALALLLSASIAATAASAAPAATLKLDKALLSRESGIVQIAFTFRNLSDSVVYLDCQGTPRASGKGGALTLSFGGADSGAGYPPERVGPGQTFTATRKLYAKIPGRENPGIALDPSPYARLRAEMAYYPERSEGEGEAFVRERAQTVSASAPLEKKGKPPAAVKPTRTRTYIPPPAQEDQ